MKPEMQIGNSVTPAEFNITPYHMVSCHRGDLIATVLLLLQYSLSKNHIPSLILLIKFFDLVFI